MNGIFLNISGVIMMLTLGVTVTRQLHFLQLNSYFNSRFAQYLKGSFASRDILSAIALLLIALSALLLPPLCLVLSVILCAVRGAYNISAVRNAKKKIVFTKRIVRMYITLGLLILLSLLLSFSPLAYAITAAVALTLSPFIAILLNIINAPLEALFRAYYINDARRILREHSGMTVIGLTGSYGKTGTKHILYRMLCEKYNVVMTPGSVNTPLGIVRVIREQLRRDTEIFLVEMGAKKVGDIREICELVHPDIGLITSVGPQHLSTFGSIENVIKTKFELADAVTEKGGKLYLNMENKYIAGEAARRGIAYVGYGTVNAKTDVRAQDIHTSAQGNSFEILTENGLAPISTRLLGAHNVMNITGAASICLDLDISPADIAFAAGRLTPTAHRLELRPYINGALLIDDAYNANPEGSVEAMRVLGSFEGMRRIVITPGMVELGVKEYEYNEKLGAAAAENADELFFVGLERSKPLVAGAVRQGFPDEHMHIVKSFTEAAAAVRPMCNKNTVVIFENDLPDNYER